MASTAGDTPEILRHRILDLLKESAWELNLKLADEQDEVLAFKNLILDAYRQLVHNTETELSTWKGFRYTPYERGENTMGISVGEQKSPVLNVTLPPMIWEFWEEQ